METQQAAKTARKAGSTTAGSSSGKCKECREKRRARCFTPVGASKCSRCEALGILCITPLTPAAALGDEDLTPGECLREMARPTTLFRTRAAIARLLEELGQRWGSHFPEQLHQGARFLMHRARAANDVALLHAAVSVCAAIRLEDAMRPLANGGGETEPEQVEALVADADEYIRQRRVLDGLAQLHSARQVIRAGTSTVTCNELFKSTFFDVGNKGIRALYMDLSVALVDDESKETLRALDDSIARLQLFEALPRTPSGMYVVVVQSDGPMVLVGCMGNRLEGVLRFESAWAADGCVTVSSLAVIATDCDAATPCWEQTWSPCAAASKDDDDDGCDDAAWFLDSLFDEYALEARVGAPVLGQVGDGACVSKGTGEALDSAGAQEVALARSRDS